MTKMALIEKLSAKLGISKRETDKYISTFVEIVTEELKQNNKVAVTGFGTFSVSDRKAREGVNPQNPKQRITIPAMKLPKFTAGKTLKDKLRAV
ncbi:MAG: HU family DNA-binding protein [Patescibacteria group bacterium]